MHIFWYVLKPNIVSNLMNHHAVCTTKYVVVHWAVKVGVAVGHPAGICTFGKAVHNVVPVVDRAIFFVNSPCHSVFHLSIIGANGIHVDIDNTNSGLNVITCGWHKIHLAHGAILIGFG